MKHWRSLFLLTLLCAIASPAAGAEEHFTLGQWGYLSLDLPAGWTAKTQGPEAEAGTAIVVSPDRDVPLVLYVTPGPLLDDLETSFERLRRAVEKTAGDLRKVSVERRLPLRELKEPDIQAWYVSVTDRTVERPSPENFRYMDQGAGVVAGLEFTFTILTNAADAPERAAALGIVRSMVHRAPGPPWRTPEGTVALAFPGKSWRVALDLPGYQLDPTTLYYGGKAVRLAGEKEADDMLITVFLEESSPGWTAVQHREEVWSRLVRGTRKIRTDVRRSERGDIAILEYTVPGLSGAGQDYKSLNAFLVHDGIWLDVHLSKGEFRAEEMQLFEKVVGTIRIEETDAPEKE